MALNVTGVDANGRITPKGTNVLIPPESAGIGDLIYKSGSTFKVIGRGTAGASTITISGSTFTLWGAIYGFINGMAMVVAPTETSAYWATSNSPSLPSGTPEYGAGTVLMRNGAKTSYYAQMNTAVNSNYIKGGGSAPVLLGSAYQATSLTAETFNANASADIKAKYGSWNEYIRQTLRVNGAPGTPFGAAVPGSSVKVYEFGRWMTQKLYQHAAATFPAAKYCYEYGEGSGAWWLPSMFELGELMIDEHLNKVNENSSVLSVSASSDRWSCVRYSSGAAWLYTDTGVSYNAGFANYRFTVRPVTLLKLV